MAFYGEHVSCPPLGSCSKTLINNVIFQFEKFKRFSIQETYLALYCKLKGQYSHDQRSMESVTEINTPHNNVINHSVTVFLTEDTDSMPCWKSALIVMILSL